jgi:autotransporter passenger strand-loop-strand repeat protein
VSGLTVATGGYDAVSAGGVEQTVTLSGGGQNDFGGHVSGLSLAGSTVSGVLYYGAETVLSGGLTSGVTISAGAYQTISSGGASDAITVSGGGDYVLSGGVASGVTVHIGGYDAVSAGGTEQQATILGGSQSDFGHISGLLVQGFLVSGALTYGQETVYAGGVASGVMIYPEGIEYLSGGTADAVTIGAIGADYVLSGGVASGVTISSGGYEVVSSGGTAEAVTVSSGGAHYTYSGGLTSGVTVANGGLELVSSGGTVNGATVLSGGQLLISSGGTATNVTVSSGGTETLTLSASQASTTLVSGATAGTIILNISGGGTASLDAGDAGILRVKLAAAGSAYAFTANNQAGLTVKDLNTLADTITLGGQSQTVTGGAGGLTVNLSSSGEDTVSDTTALFAGMTISNFATPGNILDLTDLNAASTVAMFTENNAGTAGTLSLNDGSHTASITLLGQFMAAGFSGTASSAGFSIASDGAAGSKVTYAVVAPHG